MPAIRVVLISLIAVCALASWESSAQEQAPNNVVYQIFVRSFADGDNDAAGIGDLKGIVNRLDTHLNDGNPATDTDLEVGILWLMPIFPSPTYHGYDVTDFRTVHHEYGTLADFQALAVQAHKRGVRVILDIPFNHTSMEHPWFREAIAGPSSPRRRFFHVKPGPAPSVPAGQRQIWHNVSSPSGERLQYLGVFDPHMPDLNVENPEVQRELLAVARFWLGLGADGFRLDAAKHLYGEQMDPSEDDTLKNNAWWRDFSRAVYEASPDAVLVGEVLGDRERLRRYAWGLDALPDEPFMNEVRAAVAGPTEGLVGRHKQFLEHARALNDLGGSSERTPPPFQSFSFIASHDRDPRLASDIEDFKARGMSYSIDEGYRMTLYMLLTLASHPVLYAGDELMQRGAEVRRPHLRQDPSRTVPVVCLRPGPRADAMVSIAARRSERQRLAGRADAARTHAAPRARADEPPHAPPRIRERRHRRDRVGLTGVDGLRTCLRRRALPGAHQPRPGRAGLPVPRRVVPAVSRGRPTLLERRPPADVERHDERQRNHSGFGVRAASRSGGASAAVKYISAVTGSGLDDWMRAQCPYASAVEPATPCAQGRGESA